MYASRKRTLAAAQRSMERKKREDEAPRLRDLVPNLTALQIEVVEDAGTTTAKHKRHVVVERAPALFVVACGDKDCEDGGHDITNEVMRSLRAGQTLTEGEHACDGKTGSAQCTRRIRYEIAAPYSAH